MDNIAKMFHFYYGNSAKGNINNPKPGRISKIFCTFYINCTLNRGIEFKDLPKYY